MHVAVFKGLLAGAAIVASAGDFPPADTGTGNTIHITVRNNLPDKKNYRIVEIFVGSMEEFGILSPRKFSQRLFDVEIEPGGKAVIRTKLRDCQNRVIVILESGEDYYGKLDICEPNPAIIVNTD